MPVPSADPGKGDRPAVGAPRGSEGAPRTSEGYDRAVELLRALVTEHGFLASREDRANYHRVWGRDAPILGVAALTTGDHELIDGLRRSLRTLARYQGPHGEIPSNVDPTTDNVSYGGTAGRVDADLWFVLACGQLWRATHDEETLDALLPALERVRFLLGAWEFNTRGLLYLPQTGDWADEYLQNGYVLYVQVLYHRALRDLAVLHEELRGGPDLKLQRKASRLRHLIRANYWFPADADEGVPEDVYHEVIYRKGRRAAERVAGRHWLPFFAPHGYGYRFDALANVLVSLLGIADDEQRRSVDAYIDEECVDSADLLPAFHPVVRPVDRDWEDLKVSFSNSFKNEPYEYHNGGLWPMVTGFYAADLAARGELDAARRFTAGIDRANALPMDGEPWSFPEYVHGRDHVAMGTKHQGWSAAGAILAHRALEGVVALAEEP